MKVCFIAMVIMILTMVLVFAGFIDVAIYIGVILYGCSILFLIDTKFSEIEDKIDELNKKSNRNPI